MLEFDVYKVRVQLPGCQECSFEVTSSNLGLGEISGQLRHGPQITSKTHSVPLIFSLHHKVNLKQPMTTSCMPLPVGFGLSMTSEPFYTYRSLIRFCLVQLTIRSYFHLRFLCQLYHIKFVIETNFYAGKFALYQMCLLCELSN